MNSVSLVPVALAVALSLGAVFLLMAAYRMAIQERFDARSIASLVCGFALIAVAAFSNRPAPAQTKAPQVHTFQKDFADSTAKNQSLTEQLESQQAVAAKLTAENAALTKKLSAKPEAVVTAKPVVPQRSVTTRRTSNRKPITRRPPVRRRAATNGSSDWVD